MKTLYENFTDWMDDQRHKHDLGDDYVERTVNEMTQHEFLKAISDSLEDVLKDRGL